MELELKEYLQFIESKLKKYFQLLEMRVKKYLRNKILEILAIKIIEISETIKKKASEHFNIF